jgi:hypothetical protein
MGIMEGWNNEIVDVSLSLDACLPIGRGEGGDEGE